MVKQPKLSPLNKKSINRQERGLGKIYAVCVDMIVSVTKGHVYNPTNGSLLKPIATPRDIFAFLCASCVMMAISEKMCVL